MLACKYFKLNTVDFLPWQVKEKEPKVETPTETDIEIISKESKTSQKIITQQQEKRYVEIESISDSSSTEEHEMQTRVIFQSLGLVVYNKSLVSLYFLYPHSVC